MITLNEYQERRKRLAKSLSKQSVAIIPAASEVTRNADSHYPFRQDSDFYYLTGFHEPDALLALFHDGKTLLFSRPKNLHEEQWTGKRLGQEQAPEKLGIDQAFPIASLSTELPQLLSNMQAIYYPLGHYPDIEQKVMEALKAVKQKIRGGVTSPWTLKDLTQVTSEMRLFKSDAEIALMQEAADVSVKAHLRAMTSCPSLNNEFELEAELLYAFHQQGHRSPAYNPIVASGEHACILHYQDNNKPFSNGDLILIDAGSECHGYAADITRTFPAHGKFSSEQRAVYDVVLKAQQAGIQMVKPGTPWNAIQDTMLPILTQGLVDLGILTGSVEALLETRAYLPFYMHNSGHWLGLDVHDCGAYKINQSWRPLEPGMTLTVEPGLYISSGMKNVDKRWWGIGVRIEDDILVTPEGHRNLTAKLPVDPDDIEALMRG